MGFIGVTFGNGIVVVFDVAVGAAFGNVVIGDDKFVVGGDKFVVESVFDDSFPVGNVETTIVVDIFDVIVKVLGLDFFPSLDFLFLATWLCWVWIIFCCFRMVMYIDRFSTNSMVTAVKKM